MADMGKAISEIQQFADDSVAEATVPLVQQISDLQAKNATLQDALDACRDEHYDGDADVLTIGARVKNTTWTHAEDTVGPIAATRYFHTDVPASQVRTYSGSDTVGKITVPNEVVMWVSIRDGSTLANLRSYLADMDPRTRIVLHHEPEGDYASGAAFVDWFTRMADVIHEASPTTKVVHSAASYHYRARGAGYDGSYVPPATACDIYCIDTYRGKGGLDEMVPLASDDRWLRWLSLLPEGADIGITEYGRGYNTSADSASPTNQRRVALLQADHDYLKASPAGHRVVTWQYWWTENADGDWKFEDPDSVAAWAAIAREHVGAALV